MRLWRHRKYQRTAALELNADGMIRSYGDVLLEPFHPRKTSRTIEKVHSGARGGYSDFIGGRGTLCPIYCNADATRTCHQSGNFLFRSGCISKLRDRDYLKWTEGRRPPVSV